MVNSYDDKDINYFIYEKIQKYNKKFEEFKKELDIQDEKIKKKCKKTIKNKIKENPKKYVKKMVDITKSSNQGETDETSESSETPFLDDIIKNSKGKKNQVGGNSFYDDNIYEDNTHTDIINIEKINEELEETENNDSYLSVVIGMNMFIFMYIGSFILLKLIDSNFSKYIYESDIYKPLHWLWSNIIKGKEKSE